MHELRTDLDAFIKLIIALVLAVAPFKIARPASFMIIGIVLIVAAVMLRLKPRTLLWGAASYGVIVVFPYAFGLAVSAVAALVTADHGGQALLDGPAMQHALLRLFKLFVVWYAGIVYFQTTPVPAVLGLLDRLLSPLSRIGVPIRDYLKIVMCVVLELKAAGSGLKQTFLDHQRRAGGSAASTLKHKIGAIARVIAASLASSFDKIDTIQNFVEKTRAEDLFRYTFKLARPERMALLFAALFIVALYLSESGVAVCFGL